MRWKLLLLSILCWVSPAKIHATAVDSLYQVLSRTRSPSTIAAIYGQLSFQLSYFHPDSAVKAGIRGMQIAKSCGSELSYAQCAGSLGWAYYRLGKNDSAAHYLDLSILLFRKLGERKDEGRMLVNISSVYDAEKKSEAALQSLLRARRVSDSAKDEGGKAYAERMIGVQYRNQGNLTEASRYLWSAYRSFVRQNGVKYASDVLSSLGALYLKTNIDSAFWCYRRAIALVLEDNSRTGIQNKTGIAYLYENLGTAFINAHGLKAHALDSASWYFKKARDIFTELNARQDIAYENMNLGQCLLLQEDYAGSEKAFLSALGTFDSLKAVNYSLEASQGLSATYKLMGDYKNALFYAEKAKALNDTISLRNRNDIIAELLTRYESEKKDRTIAVLDAEKKLADKELSRNRLVNSFGVTLIILLLILIVTLAKGYRTKRELQDFKIRNQLANDLHDDIGSSLSSILLLSKMAGSQSLARLDDNEIIDRIGVNARSVMDKMSDIVWTTNPKFDEGGSLRDKIEKHIHQLRNITGLAISFSVSEELDTYRFPMDIRKNIFLVFKEAVHNIVKHADATRIDVSLQISSKKLELIITDDGKGLQDVQNPNGSGLSAMNSRAAQSGGLLTIDPAAPKGTRVTLSVPTSRFAMNRQKSTG